MIEPRRYAKRNQEKKEEPLPETAYAGFVAWIAVADRAFPALPKSKGQNGDPEQVGYIEGLHSDSAALRGAGETIVVPKFNLLGTPMVDTVNNDHDSAKKNPRTLYGLSWQRRSRGNGRKNGRSESLVLRVVAGMRSFIMRRPEKSGRSAAW